MPTKEQAYDIIAELTERFEDLIDNYKRNYNETQTRLDFQWESDPQMPQFVSHESAEK